MFAPFWDALVPCWPQFAVLILGAIGVKLAGWIVKSGVTFWRKL